MMLLKPTLGVSTEVKEILIQMLQDMNADINIPANNLNYHPCKGA